MLESLLVDRDGTAPCPLCTVPVQRTPGGTLADGMAAHMAAVHPEAGRG